MKSLLFVSLLLFSISGLSMGRTDKSKVQKELDHLEEEGYQCEEVWPKNFYMSDAPAESLFEMDIKCKSNNGPEKAGKIFYKVDSKVGARCRDRHAQALKFD